VSHPPTTWDPAELATGWADFDLGWDPADLDFTWEPIELSWEPGDLDLDWAPADLDMTWEPGDLAELQAGLAHWLQDYAPVADHTHQTRGRR